MKRRDFFKILGCGILVWLVDDADAQESGGGARRGMAQRAPTAVGAWLHIGEDGMVTAYTGKVEVGQNARTSLTAAVAEELRVQPASIRMIMGDTDLTPYDMGTFGSRTTPTMWPQLRKAAAGAREMLVDLAAQKWELDRTAIRVSDGKVMASGHEASFGELTRGQKLTSTISAATALTPAPEWKVAGRSLPKVGGREIVTGAHRYAFDVRRPGMMYARILYPPSFGAKLVSLDASAARAIPGVTVVRETLRAPRLGFGADVVGVAAPDEDTAAAALAALRAEWQPLAGQPSSRDVFAYFQKTAVDAAGVDVAAAPSAGLTPYTIAYLAHVPLEPRAAVAEWSADGKLTVWTGTQRPFGVRSELAGQFGVAEESVHVIMPDTGSGYGGKHNGDAAMEAAILSKAAGRPVKRTWSREDEMTWAYFRPGGLIEVGGKAAPDGTLAEWEFHNYNSGSSGLETPYQAARKKEQFHRTAEPLRQGSYRGLAATANHFARESHVDDLAHSVGMDPIAFRLRNLRLRNPEDERLRNVLEAATERFGWKDRRRAVGHGFGLAAGGEKGGYFATCCEVSVANGRVKVVRVVEAFECGAVVNPEHLRNQVEGAIAMGLGGALFEQVDFADGKILSDRLSRYRVPRFADMPVIESVLVNRLDLPSAGAGETPIMGIAPAIGNAIFDATGQRLRSLPMAPKGLPAPAVMQSRG